MYPVNNTFDRSYHYFSLVFCKKKATQWVVFFYIHPRLSIKASAHTIPSMAADIMPPA